MELDTKKELQHFQLMIPASNPVPMFFSLQYDTQIKALSVFIIDFSQVCDWTHSIHFPTPTLLFAL